MAKNVVIIGAGAVGLSTAYYCAMAGHEVTLVERHPEQRDGCSFRNAGMVVPSHFIPLAAPGMVALGLKWMWDPESPFRITPRLDGELISWGIKFWRAASPARIAMAAPVLRDLSLASRACFAELAAAGLGFGLVTNGLLMLCKTGHALDEEARTAAMANELGIPAEVLDARGTAAKDPAVTMDVAGSVFFPMDCHLSPEQFLAVLLAEIKALGVKTLWQTEVTGLRTGGKHVHAVDTSEGTIDADEVVLCAGVWSAELARQLGLRLPMQAGKGYSLTLENPRQLPSVCSIFTEARVAVTPMDGALRVGGTMELGGLNGTINPSRVHGIVRSVPAYYPEFSEDDFAGIEPWHGLRPCPPDGLPYLGRTSRWDNVLCATGHAMMGLSLAPITGKITAGLVSGSASPIPLDILSPDRY